MLNENDLEKIFSQKKDSQIAEVAINIITKVTLFVVAFCLSYLLINFYGVKDKITFWYKNDFKEEQEVIKTAEPSVAEIATLAKTENAQAPKKVIQPDMPENSLRIPVIGVDTPISWRINNVPKDVASGLSKGVIQVNGTALPGEKGNIYITGHSSNFVWIRQQYNSIFSNISKLVVGDIIYLKFGPDVYVYKVFDQKVVGANDLSILNPTNDSRLTLATCWPLGTSLKRMVVSANQVYPNPAKNKPSKEVVTFTKLPGGR